MPDNTQDPEVAKAQQVPGFFINRFHVTVAPDVVRIAFGEAIVGTDATYRTAVVMRAVDALALSEMLVRAATYANIADDVGQTSGEPRDAQ